MPYDKEIPLYGDGIGSVRYIQHMGSDLTVVNSARVSFGVEKTELDNKDRKLIKYLIKHRHTSTLEHNAVTFRFVVPLFVRSQHHRHRTWSYNEISRRYTDKEIRFYLPKAFRTQHKSNRQASNTEELVDPRVYGDLCIFTASELLKLKTRDCLQAFNSMIDAGVCREQARMILPQNLYTEYYGTTCANNLFKFINLRLHEGAQWEIQVVAKACLEIALDLWPVMTRSYINLNDNPMMKDLL